MLILYVVPAVYWQFRPWPYPYLPYESGLPLVMIGASVMGIPFFLYALHSARKKSKASLSFQGAGGLSVPSLWISLIPALLGIAYRIYLFTLGFQGRNTREVDTVFGSETLALLLYNITFYFPIFYYMLIAFGGRLQKRFGYSIWVVDGIMQIMTLHRWAILMFLLRSSIFFVMIGWKFTRRWVLAVIAACVVTITVIGQAGLISREITDAVNTRYISPTEILPLLADAASFYAGGEREEGFMASVMRTVDDTMDRLHMARSASAVMEGTPEVIPYFYGGTFLHVFYAFIPRYLWAEKPDLRDVHLLTLLVIFGEAGVNPTGTIAELYVNYGFVAVFIGGLLCFFLCQWQEALFMRGDQKAKYWVCVYPIVCVWVFWQDLNLSQRLAEGLRGILIFWSVVLFLRLIRKSSSSGDDSVLK